MPIDKPTPAQLTDAIQAIITDLAAGQKVLPTQEIQRAFYCFAPQALADDPDISPDDLAAVLAQLTSADIPVFQSALDAIASNRQAWLAFKIVTDPSLALDSTDNSGWNFNGPGQGSADALPAVFFTTAGKEVACSRPFSDRDRKQALDITRGPHMHNRQYAGVAWTSIALEPSGRVLMLGAGDVSVQLEKLALLCDFAPVVADYDPEYLNEARFPGSQRVLLEAFSQTGPLEALQVNKHDYVCILTRGHMYDTEAIVWALGTAAGYIGMMGNPMKNERVLELAQQAGVPEADIGAERLHAPIGFKFGGKTPPELAVRIVAQLIQVRNDRRTKES